jgi:hypothetical protein
MARALLFLFLATSGCTAQSVVHAPSPTERPENTARASATDSEVTTAPPRKRRIGRLSPPFSGASAVRSTFARTTTAPNTSAYSQR